MKRLWFVGAAIALTLGSVTACGDDDDDDTGGTGGSGGTATGGTGGSETGGTGGGSGGTGGGETGGEAGMGGEGGLPTTIMCDPGGDGACENDTDCEFVESGEARTVATACGFECQAEPEPDRAQCAVDCIDMELGMTEECSGCYAALVACTAEFCLEPCVAGSTTPACQSCQAENCFPDFEDCSGLDLSN